MEIENLKRGVVSEDYEKAKKSAENLVKIGGDGVLEFLIGLLELEKPEIRNRAALTLREIENNRAIEPLLKSILKPENKIIMGQWFTLYRNWIVNTNSLRFSKFYFLKDMKQK